MVPSFSMVGESRLMASNSHSNQNGGNHATHCMGFSKPTHGYLNAARQNGKSHIDVESGQLDAQLREHPGSNQRMSICCAVM